MTFAEQVKEYERWRLSRGDNWHTPEAYEEWLELNHKADLWDELQKIWSDGSEDVMAYLADTLIS